MKTFSGEYFEVRLEEECSTVFFKGALRLTGTEDYAPILDLLRETLNHSENPIVVDLKELSFLNSSGITMFSRFVIEVRDRGGINLLFVASAAIPWQARSLKNLQRLMPSLAVSLA